MAIWDSEIDLLVNVQLVISNAMDSVERAADEIIKINDKDVVVKVIGKIILKF